MAITPSTPDLSLKSFWQRPEGKTGVLVLLATLIAGGWGLSLILPWLILLLSNTLTAVGLAIVLFGVLFVVTNKTFLSIVSNTFQLGMRWMTGLLVEIDPIGIEKNYLDQMHEEKAKLDLGVSGCAGAKEGLERSIGKNNLQIKHDQSLLEEVKRRADKTSNALALRGLEFDKQRYLQDVGRKMTTNANLQKTLDMTNGLYGMFQRMQQLADFNIANLSSQIENDQDERTAILEAYSALSPAQKLIRGEPEALKMFNQSREYLAHDNARMVGAMKDFSAISDKYLRGMDLEQGAAAADAEKMLAELEQPMLTAGTDNISGIIPAAGKVAEPILRPTGTEGKSTKYLEG